MMHRNRSRDPPPYHPGWGGFTRKLILATWVLANQNTLRAMHITGEQTREDDGKLVTRITGEQSLWVLQACLCTAGNIGWTLPINVASM